MCFIYVSKMYQLHLEQASVTTFTGCSFQIQCTRNQRSRQWITNFAVDSKHNLIGETGEWKNTYIALSWHLIPINDLLKTIFAIATDCLWHMLVYAGDWDISQPLQCSYLGLNYQIWRQIGNNSCHFHFQNKGWFERCNFCSKELLHLILECTQCLHVVHSELIFRSR